MKTNAILNRTGAWLVGLSTILTLNAAADQAAMPQRPEKNFVGTVTSVDPKEHTLAVKKFLLSRTFNLGDSCSYAILDRNPGAINDLRPGQKVAVSYRNASGVLVADRVEQQPMSQEGMVKAINPDTHELTLHLRAWDKKFTIGEDCAVTLRNDKAGTLADVKPGNHVKVVYETPAGGATAREIDQTSATYAGSLSAIDASDRTLKLKHALGTTKFHLAEGCAIMMNGKPNGQLSDLRLGDKLTLSYDPVNGVNVVDRIARDEAPAQTMTAQSTK